MTVGIWQFLAIILLLLLFFGNFSHILKDLAEGINIFKKTLKKINQ
jgi:Sec-independent protein translocase protein TatA